MAFSLAAMQCIAATLMPGNTEVVVQKGAPDVVKMAGRELVSFLSRSFGGDVPLSEAPTEGRVSVILGENDLSRAAGIDLDGSPTDTFVIKADGDRVYIAGRDDAGFMLSKVISGRKSYSTMFGHDRATLHGVYDFLERYAGVRFYFPDDELGTVVPKKSEIVVPDGVRRVTPDFLLREPYFGGDGQWHVDTCGGTSPKVAHWMRLRMASTTIPCCHGSRDFHFVERFGKSHPEYLAMKKDGTVRLDMKQFATSQYCWSNPGFREELYQDVKAYLTGQPASSRGLKGWSNNCRYGKWVDIMPEDSFQGCFCDRCQSAYGGARARNDPDYASELVWGAAAEIGSRLIKEGIPGNVTMMCYRPYRRVPDFALPTNLWVMVAENGPWSLTSPKAIAHQYGEIRAWKRKLGHKVWVWTYPSKYGELMIKGVPCVGPHAWGKYYADLKDDIIGGFCECECDRAIYNFLNYYVYSRVMWDASTDIDAVLDELYADLFGAASGEMKRMFSELERRWTTRVVGNIVDTPIGPRAVRPDNSVLWGDIYSPKFRREMDALLKAATAKVGAGSLEARRIALMRAEFYDNMVEGAAAYESQARAVEALRFDPFKGPISLTARSSGLRGFTNVANVATSVIARRTPDALEFSFTCAEPKMALCSNGYTKPGDPDCWRDNGVEIVLNPSGDGKTMFHYILTSAGNLAGQRYVRGDRMSSDWRGYLKGVKTSVKAGDAEWTGTIALPLSLLGEAKNAFKINFSRHRMLTDGTEESMTWSPYVMNFHDLERFGTIVFGECGAFVTLSPGKVEVVADAKACPTVRFAAREATNWLSRVLGSPVPLVREPSAGNVVGVVLGDNAWSRAAGVDVSSLPQDAYVVRAEPGRIYIAGRDDPKASPSAMLASGASYANLMRHDKATLFGVYGFLEEKAGVRFYLPDDELGVIARRRGGIDVEVGTKTVAPSFLIREPYMGGDGEWYNEKDAKDRSRLKATEWLRLRMSVCAIPCCHGSRGFKYIERFGETHPEYLALKADGTRRKNPNEFAAYQLCWTNPGLQETMYQDVKAYLTGQPASSRGLKGWGNNCRDGRYVDIMPDDAFQPCQCADCRAAYARKDVDPHYATEQIWGTVAKFGRRLIDEGVKGDITMMSYRPYGRIPDFDLPTNVQVMVAKRGPWGLADMKKAAEDDAQIKAWTEELGHKVWIWTYPHKFAGTAIKGVPCMAPHAWGRYFKRVSPWIFGSFAESESDKAIYNHLNYYVFSRVAWDAEADVNAIIREYHELMFGAGADDMRRAYGILERKWLLEVAGRCEDTPLGPVAKVPSAYQLWREVYSPEVRRELGDLVRSAAKKVADGSPEHRRVKLMYREIVEPLLAAAEAYCKATDVKAALERRAKEPNRSILPPIAAKGCWGGKFNLDANDFVTAPSSVHFTSTHTAGVRVGLCGRGGYPALKPNTRYRLSYFVKTKDVKPIKIPGGTAGGASVNIWDDRNHWFPSSYSNPRGNVFTGTMDWIYQEFEFTTGPLTNNADPAKGRVNRSYLQLHLLYASGEAWFDDVRLEEIGDREGAS